MRWWRRTPEEATAPTYSRAAGFNKLGSFIADLQQALKADAGRNKQDRRTGKALCVQIKASGYVGGLFPPPLALSREWRDADDNADNPNPFSNKTNRVKNQCRNPHQ